MAFHRWRGIGHSVIRENDDIYNVRHVGDIQPFSQVLHTSVQLSQIECHQEGLKKALELDKFLVFVS